MCNMICFQLYSHVCSMELYISAETTLNMHTYRITDKELFSSSQA